MDAVRASMMTPQSPESTMEEGLLIGSDFSGGYGSITPEPSIESPEPVVVGKVKKSKKSIATSSKNAGKMPQGQ